MDYLLDQVGAFFSRLLYDITHLSLLYQQEPLRFWLILGIAALLFLFLLWLALGPVLRKRKGASCAEEKDAAVRSFVPVEELEDAATQGAIMLPLPERIIQCGEHLNRETARRILTKSPKTLVDIVVAYERCSDGVKANLYQLVTEARMLENYSLHLNEDGYPLGVLVDAWNYFPDQNTLRSFVELLAHKDEQVQMNGVHILSSIKEPKSLSLLVPALVRPDRYVTARVADVFLSMPTQSAALLAYLLPEVQDAQKQMMLEIIAQAGVSFPTKNVLDCLRSKDFRVRAAACAALGAGQMTAPVPQLILAANDRQWQVRAAAAKALGQIGDMRCIPTLESLLTDKEGWVAATAKEALAVYEDFTRTIELPK